MKTPKTMLRIRLEMETALDAAKTLMTAITCDDELYEEYLAAAAGQLEASAKRIRAIANDK